MTQHLARIFAGEDELFFVQIGSNDGVSGDPLNPLAISNPRWRGIFVEPVKFLFERLRRTYGDSGRFIFENVAVSTDTGTRPFHYLAEDAQDRCGGVLPCWWSQLGSLDRGHIVRALGAQVEAFIVSVDVACLTLPDLLARHAVGRIDLLHIDAEGADAMILSQLDLALHSPRAILFEHTLFSADEWRATQARLAGAGYNLTTEWMDTLAVRR